MHRVNTINCRPFGWNEKYWTTYQVIWSLSVFKVFPSNSTSSDSLIVIDPIFWLYFKRCFFPNVIKWNFPGFVFTELILNKCIRFLISCSKLLIIKGRLLPWEYKALSSAKLQMSDTSTARKMSLIKILKSKGLNIEPWGIPRMMLAQSPYADPIFVLCLR